MTRRLLHIVGPARRRRMEPVLVAVCCGIAAVGTSLGFALRESLASDTGSRAREAIAGTTNREIYSRVRSGASRTDLVELVGSEPIRTERLVRATLPLDCAIYTRRSGGPGVYRFCFHDGHLRTKSAPTPRLSPWGR